MAANDLYNAEFMDHVSHPDYKYQMDNPTVSHEGVNPSCGDELTFSVRIEDGKIAEAAFVGSGCAISQASADIMSDLMIDRTPEEAIELCKLFERMIRGEETDEAVLDQLEDANILHDIAHMPARVKCAELAWHTLEEMLEAHSSGSAAAGASTTEDGTESKRAEDGGESKRAEGGTESKRAEDGE